MFNLIKSAFIDLKMYDAMSLFLNDVVANDEKIVEKSFSNKIFDIFKDCTISSLSKESLVSIAKDKTMNIATIKYIIFLCKGNYIDKHNSLMLFKDYENLFSIYINHEQILNFISLDNDFLQKYIELHPDLNKIDRLFLHANIKHIPFVDNDLKEALSSYLLSIKYDLSKNDVSILNNIIYLSKNFFSKIKKEDINCLSIATALEEEWVNSLTMNEINKALKFLFATNVIKDDDLFYVVNLKDFVTKFSFKQYIAILKETNVYKYKVITNKYGDKRVFYINTDNKELLNLLTSFLESMEDKKDITIFCGNFDLSLQGLNINSVNDLSFTSFIHQVEFFKSYNKRELLSCINLFYRYVVNNVDHNIFDKDNIPNKILKRQGLAHDIADGYRVVQHDINKPIPSFDKWILIFSDEDENGLLNVNSNSINLDFSSINNLTYKQWAKKYFFESKESLYKRKNTVSLIPSFFNFIDSLKQKNSDSYDYHITIDELSAFRNYLMKKYNNLNTIQDYFFKIKAVLKSIYKDTELNTYFDKLLSSDSGKRKNKNAILDADLEKIALFMQDNASLSDENNLYYLAFYLALETQLNASKIFALKIDCVKESSKKGQYVITHKGMEYPITSYTKQQIDTVIEITNKYRVSNITNENADFLFIALNQTKQFYRVLNIGGFNKYLSKCCKELGLPLYNYSNLKDTHITKLKEFNLRNKVSNIQGTTSVDDKVQEDNISFLDDVNTVVSCIYNVIIDDINVDNKVQTELPFATSENCVSDNLGYCKCDSCNNNTMFSCLYCDNFVTTIDRLPYFQEQVRILDDKIIKATIFHDKEDLISIKRLHVAYIKAILKLQYTKGL